jgi:hypothetical protein
MAAIVETTSSLDSIVKYPDTSFGMAIACGWRDVAYSVGWRQHEVE